MSTGGAAAADIKRLLSEWRARAQIYSREHRRAAARLERWHYSLGIPSTLMGAIVGTAIFGSFEKAAASWPLKMGLAVVSMTAACLAALQTFLRHLERAGQHNLAHAEYDSLARAIELLSMATKARKDWVKSLDGLAQRLDAIRGRAPILPNFDSLEREAEELTTTLLPAVGASVRPGAPVGPGALPRYGAPVAGGYPIAGYGPSGPPQQQCGAPAGSPPGGFGPPPGGALAGGYGGPPSAGHSPVLRVGRPLLAVARRLFRARSYLSAPTDLVSEDRHQFIEQLHEFEALGTDE